MLLHKRDAAWSAIGQLKVSKLAWFGDYVTKLAAAHVEGFCCARSRSDQALGNIILYVPLKGVFAT